MACKLLPEELLVPSDRILVVHTGIIVSLRTSGGTEALGVARGGMKLTEKYELVEPVTSGRINSFIARNLSTREQALIHLFECAASSSQQPAAVSVLQAFRRLAPNPPGLVLEAGTSETSSLAYVITLMPSKDALRVWVQAYKASTETTQEFDAKDGTTASLGDIMRQVVEENVQPCSDQPSQTQNAIE